MAKAVSNQNTEATLRHVLQEDGFCLSKPRSNGETGVDILAERGNEKLFIEVIGYKHRGPARSKDFFEAFFRAVSRLKDGAERCVIALPHQAGVGLPQRARQYGEAWARIGRAFPELEIWLVDVDRQKLELSKWADWLRDKP